MTAVCGLCPHAPHPANQCAAVYYEHRPRTKARTNPIPCPCWHERP